MPNRFTEALHAAQSAGRPVLDLTLSNPTRSGIVYGRETVLSALSSESWLDYDPQPKGLLSARESVASYYRQRDHEVNHEHLLLTTSTSEGYTYVFRLLADPDDEVLVPKPSYPLFEFLAGLEDVKLVPYPLLYDHGWQIDLHSLQQSLTGKTRAIVLVHPNNPTGSYVSVKERSQLNRLCRERGIALIVDEVFLDFSHGPETKASFATNSETLTFTLSGLSKISGLPQMKLAWIVVSGPGQMAQQAISRLEIIADTYLSVSTPIQLAAPTLLEQRNRVQPQLMERIRSNVQGLDRQLANSYSCTRLEIEGGWYAVMRVPVTQSDEDLAIALLREGGVLVHPGHFYDFPSEGYLVLSLITKPEVFSAGISRIVDFNNQASSIRK
jgi:alanine-synthesizing transaminase